MAEKSKTCSTCRHWTGSPQRRFLINWGIRERKMVETRLCEVPVVLPEWANLARHSDHNRTAETDGKDCDLWIGGVRS